MNKGFLDLTICIEGDSELGLWIINKLPVGLIDIQVKAHIYDDQ
jgi:hypothetical protein